MNFLCRFSAGAIRILGAYLLLAGTGGGPLAAGNHTKLVSLFDNQGQPFANSSRIGNFSVSGDGRYVAFESDADWAPNGNAIWQCHVLDRFANTVVRVSINSITGEQGNNDCHDPSISADGRLVAFESRADNLVAGDTNVNEDIFVHDVQTGETKAVSVTESGSFVTGVNHNPAISADGRYVAYTTNNAYDLMSLTPPSVKSFHVVVRDLLTGRNELASRGQSGEPQHAFRQWLAPSISEAGRYIAFTSTADNLVNGDTNQASDVFLRSDNHDTLRVSLKSNGDQADHGIGAVDNDGLAPRVSPSESLCTYVSFISTYDDLVPGDSNGKTDVFVRDLCNASTIRVSVSSSGAQGDNHSGVSEGSYVEGSAVPAPISDNRRVAFVSKASNFVPGDTPHPGTGTAGNDVFVHYLDTHQTVLASATAAGAPADTVIAENIALTRNGRYVFFRANAKLDERYPNTTGLFVRDLDPNQAPVANAGYNQTLNAGTSVMLDGGGSYDPDPGPQPLRYAWTLEAGPAAVTLANPNAVSTSFTPTVPGVYTFRLVVSDGEDQSPPSLVKITVLNAFGQSVTVISPNGGEVWKLARKVRIQWSSVNLPARSRKLFIFLTKDGGKSRMNVVTGVRPIGAYQWKIPKKKKYLSNQMLLGVCLPATKKSPAVCDLSDGPFAITR